MISWIDPKILLEMLVENIHITISKIKLIYFFNDVNKYRGFCFLFLLLLWLAFVYLFIPSKYPPGPFGFSPGTEEGWGKMLFSSRIAQPVI